MGNKSINKKKSKSKSNQNLALDDVLQIEQKKIFQNVHNAKGFSNEFGSPIDVLQFILTKIGRKYDYDFVFKKVDYANEFLSQFSIFKNDPTSSLVDEILEQINTHFKQLQQYDGNQEFWTENLRQIFSKVLFLYTVETFVYREVNKALREENWDLIKTFYPFIYALLSSFYWLESCMRYSDAHYYEYKSQNIVLYRGMNLYNAADLEYYRDIGKIFSWNAFISTSLDVEIAKGFVSPNSKIPMLFEFHCQITREMQRQMLNLSNGSLFANEQEVLVSPGTIFRIDKIETIEINTTKVNKITCTLLPSSAKKLYEQKMMQNVSKFLVSSAYKNCLNQFLQGQPSIRVSNLSNQEFELLSQEVKFKKETIEFAKGLDTKQIFEYNGELDFILAMENSQVQKIKWNFNCQSGQYCRDVLVQLLKIQSLQQLELRHIIIDQIQDLQRKIQATNLQEITFFFDYNSLRYNDDSFQVLIQDKQHLKRITDILHEYLSPFYKEFIIRIEINFVKIHKFIGISKDKLQSLGESKVSALAQEELNSIVRKSDDCIKIESHPHYEVDSYGWCISIILERK